ncbi:hypothetical protein EJB05_44517, partial [Eragrostis curvula]
SHRPLSPVWQNRRQEDTCTSGKPSRVRAFFSLRPSLGLNRVLPLPSPARKQEMKDVVEPRDEEQFGAAAVAVPICAGASFVTLVTARGSDLPTAYDYLGNIMELLFFWGLFLACVDVHSLRTNKDLHTPYHVWRILIGDWIMGINSFAAVFAATGVTIYYERDAHFCRAYPALACDQLELSVVLAFLAWSFIAASATSLFWSMASLY